MITLKDFFGMTSDEQRVRIDFDNTLDYEKVYEGLNPASREMQALIALHNRFIAKADNYTVVNLQAVNDRLNVVIMNKADYLEEVERYDKKPITVEPDSLLSVVYKTEDFQTAQA